MRGETFLMGDRRDKQDLSRLLDTAPILIHYDLMYLCVTLLEHLYDGCVENDNDFDHVLSEYCVELEMDITERLRGLCNSREVREYTSRVETAMQYFKRYLKQLHWLPLPPNVHVGVGSRGTVLQLYTINH